MRQGRRLLCTAAVIALVALTGGGLTAAHAQVAMAKHSEGVFTIGIPSGDQQPAEAPDRTESRAPAPVQVQAVWDLGAAGQWDSAQSLLRALEDANTGWKAPAKLRSYLATGHRDQRIRAALETRDWAAALALLPPASERSCDAPSHIWSRAEALEGMGNQDALAAFYIRSLTYCDDPQLVTDLAARSLSVLDTDGLVALSEIDSLRTSRDSAIILAHQRILRTATWVRFEAAVAAEDLAAVGRVVSTSDDPRLLTQAGWTFLESDAVQAAGYFERALGSGADEDARRGLVMAVLASGNIPAARQAIAQADDPASLATLAARTDLADAAGRRASGDWQSAMMLAERAAARNPELAGAAQSVSGGALLDGAGAAYDAGDYDLARSLAQQAASRAPTQRAGSMRVAWSDLQLGHASAAAAAFSRLYLERPDAEAAEGYALAAEQSGDLDTAAALARKLGGPLGARVTARYAAAAFNQGDYLTARAHAPDAYEALEGLDRTWYRQAVTARSQGGTSGENRLRGFVSTTSLGTSRGAHRVEAGIAVYTLDPGTSSSPALAPSRETLAAPYLAWSREGDTSLAARIGIMPLGADADPVLTGEIAIAREAAGRAVEARAYVRPKTDSVLALAGQEDTRGNTFGRVTEAGASVRARLPVGKVHAVQADLSAGQLEGENVASNTVVSAGISASRSIRRDGFAYIVTGPFYQFQSYDRNTNFFTPGHGGYFSPQAFHRAGWSANAQTDPLSPWIAKADIALAHETVEEDPARTNPLLPGLQPLIGGSETTGIAGALDLAIARRINTDVIISANLSAIASEAYEDVRIGVALTWVPGGRAGLVRTDLPNDPFNSASWIQP
ncbi:cellulose synthase subunit BcsC-related outer membrane protein [Hyphomonas sp.]|uniref:cellulose synthase subunit BcsC-related outer membrane protein n=1 Tax=Hyphomonas sp. TaxID=87 RepID=UPI003D2912CD